MESLKQEPRTWHARSDGYIQQNGFMRSKNEVTLCDKKGGNDNGIWSLYIDDLVDICSNSKMNDEIKSVMVNTFEMKDLVLMRCFLGIEVYQSKKKIHYESMHAKDMIEKFDRVKYNLSSSLHSQWFSLCSDDGHGLLDEAY